MATFQEEAQSSFEDKVKKQGMAYLEMQYAEIRKLKFKISSFQKDIEVLEKVISNFNLETYYYEQSPSNYR